MFGLVILGALLSPLIALLASAFRGLVLFWPAMILLGALHSFIPGVPALGWQASFLVVALLGLLIPSGNSTSE